METLLQALVDGVGLLVGLDRDLLVVVALTLQVTGAALALAVVIGLPVGVGLGLRERVPAAGCLLPLIYTGMGLPPVVVGLFVYLFLSNQGVLGPLRWLFTPAAMIVAQTIIALPLVVGLTLTAVRAVAPAMRLQIRALGATRRQLAWTVMTEARLGVLAAVVAAFGGIISEVGAVMLVGGNIEGRTRVLTTAIVLETRKGNFALALALGIILLGLAFVANWSMYHLQRGRETGDGGRETGDGGVESGGWRVEGGEWRVRRGGSMRGREGGSVGGRGVPLYALSGVEQWYGGRQVLGIGSLTIERGEILAIVGPSGAGKSTLLRLLNFLEAPAAGRICFEEQRVNGEAPLALRRRITTVFQSPNLLNRSVADNIAYGVKLRGQRPAAGVLDTWLERLGLMELAGQRATRLSAGEAQRVALARALVLRPDVLLLDEPTANLDPYNVGLIEAIVGEESARQGTTVVLVTHNIFQARRLAQRTGLLLNGRLVEVAATEVFFERPEEARTAAFVRGELVY